MSTFRSCRGLHSWDTDLLRSLVPASLLRVGTATAPSGGQAGRMTTPDPVSEHERSSNHREAVLAARLVGCFYCRKIFDPVEILEWVDEFDAGIGRMALCPKCGIDAVIPVRAGIDVDFLASMHQRWFSS